MSSLQSACVPQSPGQSGGAGRMEGRRTFPLRVQGLVSNGSLQTAGACQVPGTQVAAWVLRGVKREQSSKKSSLVWAHGGNGQSRGDETAAQAAAELAGRQGLEVVHSLHLCCSGEALPPSPASAAHWRPTHLCVQAGDLLATLLWGSVAILAC